MNESRCIDCKRIYTKASHNQMRCAECRKKHRRETGEGMSPRSCRECGEIFQPHVFQQRKCDIHSRKYKNKFTKICTICGEEYRFISGSQKRCQKCIDYILANPKKLHPTFGLMVCPVCDKEFRKLGNNQKFCPDCTYVNKHGMLNRSCIECGAEYSPTGPAQRYCLKCAKKINVKNSKIQCKIYITMNPHKVKQWSDKTYNTVWFSGNRNYVLDRDNKECIVCKCTSKLIVHHIDKSGEIGMKKVDRGNANNNENNLITLCKSCHAKLHYQDEKYNISKFITERIELLYGESIGNSGYIEYYI